MAETILKGALETELHALHFYQELLKTTTDPSLTKVYKPLAAFEEEHVRLIETRLKEFQS